MVEDVNLALEAEDLDFSDFGEAEEGGVSAAGQDTEEQGESAVESAEEPRQEQSQAEEGRKHTVKFLGREREMTEEELLAYAQKGLNYDHVVKERDELREAKELKMLDSFAAASGMTREQFLSAMEESAKQREMRALLDKQVPPEVAERLVALEKEAKDRREREAAEAEAEKKREAFRAFVREYPDVKTFPGEVAEAIARGEAPLHAYRAYEVRQLKTKLAELTQKESGRKKAIGALADTAAPTVEDDFLSAFGKE